MKIVLGVCGGIAAYKAAELIRDLRRRGADVQVIMTESAERFISALTLATLSGTQVMTSLWQPIHDEIAQGESDSFGIEHIQVVQQADAVVIAPATANVIAKLAHGLADDFLSTACLAATCPIVIAPAMNSNMWSHAATCANVRVLRDRNVHIVEPGSGELACGMVGDGRLAEPSMIADRVLHVVSKTKDMLGETVLVTAGGTREPLDAVRFIGNRSSGKMGMAVAAAALARGAQVLVIHAAISVPVPAGCEAIYVETAAELERAVLDQLDRATILVMAAAVSDYTALEHSPQKRKKTPQWDVTLTQTPDILHKIVAERKRAIYVVGFAAETERVREEGRRKLRNKGVDMIVANDVSQPLAGFESENNEAIILTAHQEIDVPLSSKQVLADRILDAVRDQRPICEATEKQQSARSKPVL